MERTLRTKTFGVHPDSKRKSSGAHFTLTDLSAESGVGVKGHRLGSGSQAQAVADKKQGGPWPWGWEACREREISERQ